MRIAVGLLACFAASAVTTALADPQKEAAPATNAAPATTAAAAAPTVAAATDPAAAKAEAAKAAELDKDTQHFLAEGYKPEMHHGEQVYCHKDAALGSRVNMVKTCGTIEQLKLNETAARSNVSDMQRAQTGTSSH